MAQFAKGVAAWEIELAWAAGLFDGEGTIGLRRNGTKANARRIGMALGMTTPEVVERFAKAVGVGTIYHSQSQSNYPNSLPITKWVCHSIGDTDTVVSLLWPWLSEPKRVQAQDALDAYSADPHRNGSALGKVA